MDVEGLGTVGVEALAKGWAEDVIRELCGAAVSFGMAAVDVASSLRSRVKGKLYF